MAWRIELTDEAQKALGKLGANGARRIAKGLREVGALEDPRQRGEVLSGNLAGHWRYFGDYRAIARIEGDRMVILVITIGHRREVYR